ncbi:MAG: fibronectin type III domain-containing protein, partial [Patescibacteria group bacterium]|nr:fibronectin type III domain-containing protein [Patescibacteria group bacterium]
MKKIKLKFKLLPIFIGLSTVLLLLNIAWFVFFQKVISVSYKTSYSGPKPFISEVFHFKNLSILSIDSNFYLIGLAVFLGLVSFGLFLTRKRWEPYLSDILSCHPYPRLKKFTFHKYLHWIMLGLTILTLVSGLTLDFKQNVKESSARTFDVTRSIQAEFQYANGVSGTESSRTNVDITTTPGDVTLTRQTTTVDNGDNASNWVSSDTGGLAISQETTDVKEGTGSVKAVGTIGALGSFSATSPALPQALSDHSTVSFTPTSIASGTEADGTLDLSLGNGVGGCNGLGLSWDATTSTCTINTDTKNIFNFTTINITSGSTLTATGSATATKFLTLRATGNATMAGTIDVRGKGYAAGSGPGSGGDTPTTVCTSYVNFSGAGGGGYGGVGAAGNGNGGCAQDLPGAAGSTYGDADSLDLGSGGGTGRGNSVAYGGTGGGGLQVVSGATLTVTGTINASGSAGVDTPVASGGGGGGSGGKIILQADTLTVSGTLNAKGGKGGSSVHYHGGGGGGGGRITLKYKSSLGLTGTTDVSGGNGGTGEISSDDAAAGSSGVLTKIDLNVPVLFTLGGNSGAGAQSAVSKMAIDSSGVSTFSTVTQSALPQSLYGEAVVPIAPSFGGTGTDGTLDLSLGGGAGGCNGTGLSWDAGTSTCTINTDTKNTFNFTTINITSGSTLTATGSATATKFLTLRATGNATMAGTINLDGKGYPSDSGPGAGIVGSGVNGLGRPRGSSGGGYGGKGGSGYQYVTGFWADGGIAYGDSESLDLGSGGASRSSTLGGAGGGGIRITSGNKISISGVIKANGLTLNSDVGGGSSGGGSGGKIVLKSKDIDISGSVTANGGTGGYSRVYSCPKACTWDYDDGGGGGGGGRITISYTHGLSKTGTISALGGAGGDGGASLAGNPGNSGVINIQDVAQGIYVLGGNNGSSAQSTTYRGSIDLANMVSSTPSATNQGVLPQALYDHRAVSVSINNVNYLYVLGGNNGSIAQSTVYKATIIDGDISSFSTSSASLPVGLYGHSVVTANVGGTNYLYVIGGHDGTSAKNTVYRAILDSNGDIGGSFSTTNQAQLTVNSVDIPLYNHTTLIRNIGGTNYLYVIGGNNGTTDQTKAYQAIIDNSGNVGSFTSLGYILPTALSSFTSFFATVSSNSYVYILGGSSVGTAQSTIYRSTLSALPMIANAIKSLALDLSNKSGLAFWIKSSKTGQYLQLQMGESTANENTYDITINQADTWEQKTWDITGIGNGSKDGITKVALKVTESASSGFTLYLDDLLAVGYISPGEISNMVIDAVGEAAWDTLSWNSSTPTNTFLAFNVRTASTFGGLASASWSASVSVGMHNLLALSLPNDQFLEVKASLTSTNGVNTPTLSDFTVRYVQNAPPSLTSPSVTMATDGSGIITVGYSLSDFEEGACTDNGSCAGVDDGLVNVSFQYSTDSAGWITASTVSQSGLIVNSGIISVTNVHQADTVYSATWNTKTDLGTNVDGITYYVRVHADDGNSIRNTANTTPVSLSVDTKAPISPSIVIMASPSAVVDSVKRTNAKEVTLNLSATDSSAISMMISKDASFTNGIWESYVATKSAYPLDTSSNEKTNTIYAKFKDAFGNVSSTVTDVTAYDSSAPNTPANLKIADISDVDSNVYRLIVSWSRIATPTANDFSAYKVYRSTDGTTYASTPIKTIIDRTDSYFVDQDLIKNQWYYYKIKSVDAVGNASSDSNLISAAPSIGDLAAPALTQSSSVSVAATTTTATFTFSTDRVAYGYVDYAPSISPTYIKTVGEASAVSASPDAHNIILTNLNPNTIYKYQVRVKTVVNFEGKAKEATVEENKTFTTLPLTINISNVQVLNIATSSAVITWQTSETTNAEVQYGTTSSLGLTQSELSTNNAETGLAHSALLTSLTPGTTYYYRVKSGDVFYPESNISPSSFTTASYTKIVGVPPIISGTGPSVTSLSTSVTVTWSTDKVSDSYIEYGLLGSYGTVSGKDDSTLSHSVTITGLIPSTTYHFRVKSKDSDGNTGTSNDSTFTTKDKSVITEVTISDISLNSAILSWTTNVISKSNVKIGTKI